MWNLVLSWKWVLGIAGSAMAAGSLVAMLTLGHSFHFDAGAVGRSSTESALVVLGPYTVNLADDRFLRLTLAVELTDARAKAKLERYQVHVNDAVLVTLASNSLTTLQSPEAKVRVRDEVIQRLKATVPDLPIRNAYFLQFLIHN